jgi:ribosomal protein S12 methylthiotransferase
VKKQSFNLVSLGCPKNRVDSERILASMESGGYTFTDDPASADIVVINTCAFIEPAAEESINTILDYAEDNPEAFLVVAGCLPLRYKEDLKPLLPEVDLFLRPDQIPTLPSILNVVREKSPELDMEPGPADRSRIITTPGYAYLKIAEGCFRSCHYCTIPDIRGKLKSEAHENLIREAEFLATNGVRELILVAQDLTSYGRDQKRKNALLDLLGRLEKIESIRWIRLMYLHPDGIPDELPKIINQSDKILKYLDIPFQHISSAVLKSMGRPWKGDRLRRLVDRLREEIAGLVLRTTFMVGYPTEGEKEYAELREFLETYRIERVGVFTYSPEEGTKAFELGDPTPFDVKQARAQEISDIQAGIIAKRNKSRLGSTDECLVEGVSDESDLLLQGRLWDQAPEIDGTLYITGGAAVAGAIHSVQITGAHELDLFGEIIEEG